MCMPIGSGGNEGKWLPSGRSNRGRMRANVVILALVFWEVSLD